MVDMSPKEKSRRRRGRKSEGEIRKGQEETPSYTPHSSLLIQITEEARTWYRLGHNLPERDSTTVTDPPPKKHSPALVAKYRALADQIYAAEVQVFNQNKSKDDRWVESTMRKGTLKDRIAAMSVVISNDPVHKFYALSGLMQMAGCSESSASTQTNSRVAQLAAEALQDLFLHTFMPHKRKLMTLAQRPLHLYEQAGAGKTKHTLSPRILLLWRFEEMVQDQYRSFLRQYLNHTLSEGVELQKIFAIRLAATLLRSIPEGEEVVLQALVNKLGDPVKKVAAAAGHELRRVLQQHPVMQGVIAREVQQLAHRPHLSSRALYNCIIFLNQLTLKTGDDLPASLISTYFGLFEVAVQQQHRSDKMKTKVNESESGMKSRLLSALLTGVNRAHPYLPKHDQNLEKHVDALYRVVHKAPPAACTQALLLLFHVSIGSQLEDEEKPRHNNKKAALDEEHLARQHRFYRALYSTLSEPALLSSGKHLTMFFNLLYKAMKYDTDVNRVGAFAKRVLATTIHSSSNVTAASLFLLNEIAKKHPVILTSYDEVLDERDDSMRILDAAKRDPRYALVVADDKERKDEENKLRRAPGWELSLAVHHFHPSVRKFANGMGDEILYTGDPLKDFALAPFLDKFAYRNPKSAQKVAGKFQRGQSVAERKSGTESMIQSHFALPVNDQSFLAKQDVCPEDEFFHQFFIERSRRDKIKGIERHTLKDKKEDDEVGEEEALDAVEQDHMDPDSFEEYERQWEDDPDEEAFVDSLAEQIIEDSIGENGPADLDEEDPDTEGWDDLYKDEDGGDKGVRDSSDSEAEVARDDADQEDVDAFMDDDDDATDSSDNNVDKGALFNKFEDDSDSEDVGKPPFSMAEDDSDVEDVADDDSAPLDIDDVSASSDDMDFAAFAESSSEEEEEEQVSKKKSRKGHKNAATSTFAAAEDYEEQISNSWNELKRSRSAKSEVAEEASKDEHPKRRKKEKRKQKK